MRVLPQTGASFTLDEVHIFEELYGLQDSFKLSSDGFSSSLSTITLIL